jgi:hypothetical protein
MRKLILSTAAIAASVAFASPAAAAILFAGGSQGCFVAPAPGSCVTSIGPVTDGGLTFTGGPATFSQLANSSGFAAIGGPTNNFGTITLSPNARDYGHDLFNLLVTFTAPVGTGSGSFSALLTGQLTTFGSGGVQISFVNHDVTVTDGVTNYILHVNDVSFSGGTVGQELPLRQDISGFIRAVPEPSTWGMMLLGFAGIGMAIRRRRKPALAQLA